MGLIDTLKAAGELKIYLDFREGVSDDQSENSWASSVLSNASIATDHIDFSSDTGYLEVPYNSGFVSESGSVIVFGEFLSEDTTDFPLWSIAGLGDSAFFDDYWSLLRDDNGLVFKTPGASYSAAGALYGKEMVAATFEEGSPVKFYLNDNLEGSSTTNFSVGSGLGLPGFRVGFTGTGGALNTTGSEISIVVFTTRVLSEDEIAEIYKDFTEDGLLLYRDAGSATYVAHIPSYYTDKTYIETTLDCELGQTSDSKLFLRNENDNYYFTDIKINTSSLTPFEDTLGIKTGWGAKLYAGDTQPTEAQWEATDYGNSISLSDLGAVSASDTSTYLPFWFRVECPAGIQPTVKENIAIEVSYTKTAA